MGTRPSDSELLKRLYGRRSGRSLRIGQKRLIETLLPRLRVPLTDEGPVTNERPVEGEPPLDPARLFPRPVTDVWLEVGFGGGEHLAAQAEAHPEIGLIGCEPFVNGVASLLAHIEDRGIENIRIYDDNARAFFGSLPDASLGRVFVLFNDPWPKARHAKRRFLNAETLDALARLMKDGADLRFASDDSGYMTWSLERMIRHPAFTWTARRPGDWRTPPDDGFETRYEAKAKAAGRTCIYLCFRRLARG